MGALFGLIMLLVYGGIFFLAIGGYWKTFSKAGQPGWACLVPIYNMLVMADIARVSRAKAWQAMGVAFIGTVIYMVMLTSAINEGGTPDFGSMGIAMLVVFAASILSLVIAYPIYKGIAINFGQSEAFAWGLMLLNVIFFAILGFGNYQYQGSSSAGSDDILDSGF